MTRSSPFRLALVAGACILAAAPALAQTAPKAPEPATLKANAEMVKSLPFADRQDFEDAMRGFVGTVPDALVPGPSTRPAWNLKPYDFLKADTPIDSVNPSLWRQAQLNLIHGLFKVTDRVYQVRGFDLANMTTAAGCVGRCWCTSSCRKRPEPGSNPLVAQAMPASARTQGVIISRVSRKA